LHYFYFSILILTSAKHAVNVDKSYRINIGCEFHFYLKFKFFLKNHAVRQDTSSDILLNKKSSGAKTNYS